MKTLALTSLLLSVVFLACSSSRESAAGPLTAEEKQKLDPQLRFLFDNPTAGPASSDLDIIHHEEGGVIVGVDVYMKDPSKLRDLGIDAQVTKNGKASCHVDLSSLRKILREETVSKVLARKGALPAK